MSSKKKVSGKETGSKPALVPKLRFPEFRNAEGWIVKSFDELFTIGNGRDYKHLNAGDVPVYGSGGYMLTVNDYLYDGESVCIGRKGTIDKPMFLTGRFWTVDTLFYTHSFKECLPKFIFAIFQQIEWLKHNEAGGIPSLAKTTIQKIHATVPKPAEQQKITECLSSVDDMISAQTRKVDALKAHKKGLMQQLFPQEGKTQPRLRFLEFRNKNSWRASNLDNLGSFTSGGTPSKAKSEYWGGDIPWVTASSMHDLIINKADHYVTSLAIGNGTRITKKGSILILVRGSMLFKRVPICIVDIDVAFNQDVKSFNLNSSTNVYFLVYQLTAFQFRFCVNETGIGAGKIDSNDLKEFAVFIPNIKEQQRIADCLSSLDNLTRAEVKKLDALKLHKKGLMQQLFPSSKEG